MLTKKGGDGIVHRYIITREDVIKKYETENRPFHYKSCLSMQGDSCNCEEIRKNAERDMFKKGKKSC
jgi:hypothetical protein